MLIAHQLVCRLGYPIKSVQLGQNMTLALITIVWKSQCRLSNHIFIITFSAATWSDEEEALIAEFQAILATTSRNALVGAGDTLIDYEDENWWNSTNFHHIFCGIIEKELHSAMAQKSSLHDHVKLISLKKND